MAAVHPASTHTATEPRRQRRAAYAWAPLALLGAGLLLGIGLWAKWGLAIAFEAVRAYCF